MNKLKFVVDKKNYHKFKGADWPSYESFIAGDYKMPDHIKQEIDEFVSIMDEKYEDLTNPKIKELSLANQMRQNQTFYNKNTYTPLYYWLSATAFSYSSRSSSFSKSRICLKVFLSDGSPHLSHKRL